MHNLKARFDVLDEQLPALDVPLLALRARNRQADLRRRAVGAATSLLVLMGGAIAARTSMHHDPGTVSRLATITMTPDQERLLQIADDAAARDGGKAVHVDVVESSRVRASHVISGTDLPPSLDVPVWAIQIEGDFVCRDTCSSPRFAGPPSGRYLKLLIVKTDFQGVGGGLGPNPTDLTRLGTVTRLR